MFSHGNGSAPWKYDRLVGRWREAGYDVWMPLHVDSTDHPRTAEYPGLATWRARLEDMRAVSRFIDGPYVAAGHSYGALTALVMGGAAGEVPEGLAGPLRDAAAACVLAFSPPPPIAGLLAPEGYAALATPALVQTGTLDLMPDWPETDEGWRIHRPAFDLAAATGDRYLLVFEGVDHDFGGAICDVDRGDVPQLGQLSDAADLSLDFLAAFFPKHDAVACERLDRRLATTPSLRFERK